MPLPTTGLEVLERAESLRLIESSTLGRVVLSRNALPTAFPVSYRLHRDRIVFRTEPGTKLSRALGLTIVGFEVDSVNLATNAGWSVLIIGSATLVTDRDEVATLDEMNIRSLAADRLPHLVQISINTVSGRRIPASTA